MSSIQQNESISVRKQSVEEFLKGGSKKPFVIPEYQRPYAWEQDEVQTLFEDIWNFAIEQDDDKGDEATYFLGSVVAYYNEEGEQEIIDGQQRITTLFLLLRAIYAALEKSEPQTDRIRENFMTKIGPTIWREDKYTGEIDRSQILLESRVINEEGNKILRTILETGVASNEAKDNYSKNYLFLQKLYKEHSALEPLHVKTFIYALLNWAIVLPISADKQETALTIFSTLNNRGLPLSDADIFKAKIYGHCAADQKADFIEQWQNLSEEANRASESLQSLFYYYMFYLRAVEKDSDTTTPGIRKYYFADNLRHLYEEGLMRNLFSIANFMKIMNKRILPSTEDQWTNDKEILQLLDTLRFYPNEFGKYPTIIYYLKHSRKDGEENKEFAEYFKRFLKKLLKELIVKFVLSPTVNSVKKDVLKLNVEIISSLQPKFSFPDVNTEALRDHLRIPHHKTVRMLLCILAYAKQKELLPMSPVWEIEHIFPKKWENTYFPKEDENTVREKIEYLGNKIPFEKKLNVIASNGYFGKKKTEYAKSQIAIVREMSESQIPEWGTKDIDMRSVRVTDNLLEIFKKWADEYDNYGNGNNQPTPEELAKIQEFRDKGWV